MSTKEGFVISLAPAADDGAAAIASGSAGLQHIDPRENFAVAIRVAGATLQSQILEAMILGLVVAILAVVGVDRTRANRSRRESSRAPDAPDGL